MKKHKSLNRNGKNVFYPMNKRGQIIEIGLGVIMLIITLYGTYSTLEQGSQKIYVGDSRTRMVYDYSECKNIIDNIPDTQKILFRNLDIILLFL